MSVRITREEIIKHFRSLPHMDDLLKNYIIKDSLPILSFGDFLTAHVLTIGINPSPNEYDPTKDRGFKRLSGDSSSTNWDKSWSDAQIYEIYEASSSYFDHHESGDGESNNWVWKPYWDEWFQFPEIALSKVGASYKSLVGTRSDSTKILKASHIDITPWATDPIWSEIPTSHQNLVHNQLREQNKEFLFRQMLGDQVKCVLVLGATTRKYLFANLNQSSRVNNNRSTRRSGAVSFNFYPGLVAEGFGVLPPIYYCSQSPSTKIPKSSDPELDGKRKETLISIYEEFGSRIAEHWRTGEWQDSWPK